MRIPITKVPLELRRKAAQHLENVRDTEMGIGAKRAKLAEQVCPMYRPDRVEIAYYEFEVDSDQKQFLKWHTDRLIKYIQFQVSVGSTAGTGTAGQIDSAVYVMGWK